MSNSEEYTVVWAGTYHRLKPDEVPLADKETHPLMKAARKVRLGCWFDTFEIDEISGENAYCLLIGENLGILGYKEGKAHGRYSRKELDLRLMRIGKKLHKMGIKQKATLHVLLRIMEE